MINYLLTEEQYILILQAGIKHSFTKRTSLLFFQLFPEYDGCNTEICAY